ncbi:hypothetical protein N7504_011137 [Penicillium tannophilum]|nr:hypothetical protein N7504_011137 [Penicillium tannophilum]
MHFSIISVLAGMVSALSSEGALVAPVTRSTTATSEKVEQAAAASKGSSFDNESETSNCVGSLLCCGSLTTPLDHIVDPIFEDLGVDASAIVGSVGLLCMSYAYRKILMVIKADILLGNPYEASICTSAPQCYTELNLLGGTVALECLILKN